MTVEPVASVARDQSSDIIGQASFLPKWIGDRYSGQERICANRVPTSRRRFAAVRFFTSRSGSGADAENTERRNAHSGQARRDQPAECQTAAWGECQPPPVRSGITHASQATRHFAAATRLMRLWIAPPAPYQARAACEADRAAQRLREMNDTSSSPRAAARSIYLAYELLLASAW